MVLQLLRMMQLQLLLLVSAPTSSSAAAGQQQLDSTAAADRQPLSFDSIFRGGSAVLQRRTAVTVRGNCPPDTAERGGLRLSVDGAPVNATAQVVKGGRWQALLPPQKEAWRVLLSVSSGDQTASVRLSFGEVLLCSGQSNMQMPVAHWAPCCDNKSYVGRCSCFSADNGTAAAAAAGRYTEKISLATVETPFPKPAGFNGSNCPYPWTNASCISQPMWNRATPGPTGTVHGFSALCWYTAVALYEQLDTHVPVGAIVGSVGGSPIEFWVPAGHVNNSVCGADAPACDDGGTQHYVDSEFFERLIQPFMPYTLGSVLWDQAERDVHCLPAMHGMPPENTTARYACLEQQLVRSWRKGFNLPGTLPFLFVAVQLPGYLGDCGSFDQCLTEVFKMRLQQEKGVIADPRAFVTPTYDLGCPFGVRTPQCPFGSVHNVNKTPIAARIASQLIDGWIVRKQPLPTDSPVPKKLVQGPVVSSVFTTQSDVQVEFSGGTGPLHLRPTQNCRACCHGSEGDFDVGVVNTAGQQGWRNASIPTITVGMKLQFKVQLAVGEEMTHVRFTGNQPFPQCAVYNSQGRPALPFVVQLRDGSTAGTRTWSASRANTDSGQRA
jgi:hypothetical protein